MRKILLAPLFLIVIVVFILLWGYQSIQPATSDNKVKDFLITKGSSAGTISQNLFKQGLIKSPLAFKFYVQLTGKQNKIQAGEFSLAGNKDLFSIVTELLKGPSEIWVTIPEGLRREQVAEKFTKSLNRDNAFTNEFLRLTEDEEGFLFPDTYLFPKEASPAAIVKKMKSTFDSKFTSEMRVDASVDLYSVESIATLASILERETLGDAEKPVVAGILRKRIEAGWPLQADATVQYLGGTKRCTGKFDCEWWQPVNSDELASTSRFNTYKFQGLPPAPIASAGTASLKAAIYPEKSDYWFYIHDSKGVIHYAKTLEEHNANISQYLR